MRGVVYLTDKKKDSRKKEAKSNGRLGGLKIYSVNGSANTNGKKKEEEKEKTIKAFLIALIAILSVAAIFAAIYTFFPNFFGRFSMQGEIAARVNEKVITMQELNTEYDRLPLQYKYFITKEAFLSQLIDETLLYEEALKQGFVVSNEEIQATLDKFIQQNNLTKEQLDQLLIQKKLTMEDLKNLVRNQLTVDKLLEKEVLKKVNVSDEMALKYYNENLDAFLISELVTARHILVSINKRSVEEAKIIAEQVMSQIKSDKSNFCELVKTYSEDTGSLDNCGEYLFPKGQMVPEFEEAAFNQEVGGVSLVKTSFGYHIVWTVNKTPEHNMSFDEVKEQIKVMLGQQQQRMLYSELIVRLREKAKITNYLEQKENESMKEKASTEEEEGIAAPEIEVTPSEEKPEEKVTETNAESKGTEAETISKEQEELEKTVEPSISEVKEEGMKPESAKSGLSLAQCLNSKGVILYGAYWDSSTKKQKEYFGSNAAELRYVECGVQGDYRAQQKICEEAGILAYPTWVINGKKYMGVQTLSQLAALTGCEA